MFNVFQSSACGKTRTLALGSVPSMTTMCILSAPRGVQVVVTGILPREGAGTKEA